MKEATQTYANSQRPDKATQHSKTTTLNAITEQNRNAPDVDAIILPTRACLTTLPPPPTTPPHPPSQLHHLSTSAMKGCGLTPPPALQAALSPTHSEVPPAEQEVGGHVDGGQYIRPKVKVFTSYIEDIHDAQGRYNCEPDSTLGDGVRRLGVNVKLLLDHLCMVRPRQFFHSVFRQLSKKNELKSEQT